MAHLFLQENEEIIYRQYISYLYLPFFILPGLKRNQEMLHAAWLELP